MSRDIDAQRYYWMLLQFSIYIECCSSTPGGALGYCTIDSRISRQVALSRRVTRPRYSDPAAMTRWLFQDADHPSMPVPTCGCTQRLLWPFDFCGHNANQIRIIWTRAHLDVLQHPPARFGRIWCGSFVEKGLCGQADTHIHTYQWRIQGGGGSRGSGPPPLLGHDVGFLTLGTKLGPPFFACRPKMDPSGGSRVCVWQGWSPRPPPWNVDDGTRPMSKGVCVLVNV